MNEQTRHYLISGRVQGVGYRAFAAHCAHELSLSGWVRNLADGRVECVARGTAEQLDQFEGHLRQGPDHGRVDSIEVLKTPEPMVLEGFQIRKNGVGHAE